MNNHYDVAIIGGGINGCGIAAEASSRGLKVFLCDKHDFASHTSSRSTKLIHGGLRYLEQYDFALVRKALKEREILLHTAPHLVKPIEIVMPHAKNQRPAWMIRLGLFLYDHIGGRSSLPRGSYFTKSKDAAKFNELKDTHQKAFSYYDGSSDDARLTLENALLAQQYGASLHNYTRCEKANYKHDKWHIHLSSKNHKPFKISAHILVNATGPFVNQISADLQLKTFKTIKKIKGSHIVINKKPVGNFGYLLQHEDKRVIFVLPYHNHTMIGTTDVIFNGNLDEIKIDNNEIKYLIDIYNLYFKTPITKSDIIDTWSGVRPLIEGQSDNPSELSRDFYLEWISSSALLNVYGGKITTYRELAKDAVDLFKPLYPKLLASQSARLKLPGAQCDIDFNQFKAQALKDYSHLPPTLVHRWLETYGVRFKAFMPPNTPIDHLGADLGSGFTQGELSFLKDNEWVQNPSDILWRRTKLGLLNDKTLEANLENHFNEWAQNPNNALWSKTKLEPSNDKTLDANLENYF